MILLASAVESTARLDGPIRVAILGCGRMNRNHVKAFLDLPDECQVTWAVDVDAERAREVAELTGAQAATSLDGLWDEFDAIDICTPHHLHAEQSIEALHRGKHVLVEKPMATTREDAERMLQAAEEARRILMVGYVMRYHPLVAELRRHVVDQTYGRPMAVTMINEGLHIPHSDWLRWKRTRGGGVLFSHGCHYIDLLIWMFGPIRRATCMRNKLVMDQLEGEETAAVLCEFTSGTVGTFSASQGMRHGRKGLFVVVNCRDGRLELDLLTGELSGYVDGEREVLMRESGRKPMREQTAHFLACIRENRQPLTSGRETIHSLEAIWSMYDADRQNRIATVW